MALIETTDDFFTKVTEYLSYGRLEEYGIIERLDGIYLSLTEISPHSQKSSIVIWDEFEGLLDENLVGNIQNMLVDPKYGFLSDVIKKRYAENAFYHQSVILFIYWMLINRKQRLLRDWPFQQNLLQPFAVDLGISTWDDF